MEEKKDSSKEEIKQSIELPKVNFDINESKPKEDDSMESKKVAYAAQLLEILNKRKRQKLRQVIFFQKWTRVIKSEKVTEMTRTGKNLD